MSLFKTLPDLVKEAFIFAKAAHEGQLDDDGKDFFTAHPMFVCLTILVVAPKDYNLQAAALLHDVIEDTDTTYEELKATFGADIADLVHEVTHEGQKDAHGYYFPRLHSQRGVMLKYADRLSNLSRLGGEKWSGNRAKAYVKKSIKGFPTEGPDAV